MARAAAQLRALLFPSPARAAAPDIPCRPHVLPSLLTSAGPDCVDTVEGTGLVALPATSAPANAARTELLLPTTAPPHLLHPLPERPPVSTSLPRPRSTTAIPHLGDLSTARMPLRDAPSKQVASAGHYAPGAALAGLPLQRQPASVFLLPARLHSAAVTTPSPVPFRPPPDAVVPSLAGARLHHDQGEEAHHLFDGMLQRQLIP